MIKVGDPIYQYDMNRRVYRKGKDGHTTGSPITREHWVEKKIIGETTRSWLIGPDWSLTKLPKKDLAEGKLTGYCLSLEEVEQRVFVADHRHLISTVVSVQDYDKLKAIADLIGYKPEDHVK